MLLFVGKVVPVESPVFVSLLRGSVRFNNGLLECLCLDSLCIVSNRCMTEQCCEKLSINIMFVRCHNFQCL